MIFNCIQMAINAAQRGTGNTKIAMCTNVIANVINIIMNYLLIEGHWGFPALGIVGAALATVIGTVVSCIISVCSIFRKDNYINIQYIIRNKVVPSISDFIDLGKVGYSVLFEQLLMRIGFVMTALMAAKQGNDAMAVHQVGMNIIGLSFSFGDGLQSTAVALIGRSLGENKEERAKEYGHICKVIGSTIAVVLALIYLIGARGLYSLFFKEEHIIDIGVRIMYVVIFIVIFQISQVVYMGCLRGGGDTAYTAMASTISVTFVRTITSYFFGYILNGGIVGIWIGILGNQISRYLFASTRFKQGKWTKIRI